MAHVILHTSEGDFSDTETTPRSLCEVEAEAVALLCCESLGLEGANFRRGYIQNWLRRGIEGNAEAIPEKSAQKSSAQPIKFFAQAEQSTHNPRNTEAKPR